MAAPKSIPPSRPAGLSGGKSTLPLIRAGMGAPDVAEIEAWTDEQYRRATGLFTVLSASGQVDRQAVPAFEPPALREAYRAMLRARALDAAARELVKAERIGSYAASTGTEAAVVGAMAALSPDDVVAPGRRAAGAAIARGYPLAGLVAQLFGNAHDLSRGRRLPGCPTVPRALNILPASEHAGTQLPQAAGVAWAAKMQKKPTVALATLRGDRDRRRGLPHRRQLRGRLPAAGDLPLPERRQVEVADHVRDDCRAGAGLRHRRRARRRRRFPGGRGQRARCGGAGPARRRRHAHRGGGPRRRRRQRRPLARLGGWLASEKVLDATAAAAMRVEVEAEIRAAIAAEEAIGPPPSSALIEQVLARPSAALEEQLAELDRARRR